jgi:Raf kinase inhibitor-like YbhB/YbcL family protein
MSRWSVAIAVLVAGLLGACSPGASPSPPPPTGEVGPVASSAPSSSAPASPDSPMPSTPPLPSLAPSPTGGAVSTPTPEPTPTPTHSPKFTLTSAAFHAGGTIPRHYTCDGSDTSPALSWTGVPDGAGGLALVVDDPDASGFAHWLVYDIPAGTTHLAAGAGAAGSTHFAQGTNDFGRVGYGGPCPPSGAHHYHFTLYALAAPLGLSGHPRASAVRAALARANVLVKATLIGTYAR